MRKIFILLTLLLPLLLFAQVDAIDGIWLNKAVPDGRVDSVYQGLDLPQAFTGEDVGVKPVPDVAPPSTRIPIYFVANTVFASNEVKFAANV